MPHRRHPCRDCPWRRDAPAGQFASERFAALRATSGGPGAEAPIGAPVFACHASPDARSQACAGWLAVEGWNHLGVRLAVAINRLPGSVLGPDAGWPALHGSYDEMVRAQP